MEHVCNHAGCGWATFDNCPLSSCPQHPGESSHYFDEPEHDEEPPEDEEDFELEEH